MSEAEIKLELSELETLAELLKKNNPAKLTRIELWIQKYELKKLQKEIEKLKYLLSQTQTNE